MLIAVVAPDCVRLAMLVRVSVARAASAPGVEAADPGFELDLGFPRVRVWWSVAVWRIPKLLRQSLCVESGQCEHLKSYMETLQCLLSKKKKRVPLLACETAEFSGS